MPSEPKLKRLFMKLNRKWFGGLLPTDTDVYWEATGHAALTTHDEAGRFIVKIDPGVAQYEKFLEQLLIHEMVHIEQWHFLKRAAHGRKFWDRIKELVHAGAYKDLL